MAEAELPEGFEPFPNFALEEDMGVVNSWTRAISDQPLEQIRTPHYTIRYLLAEQANFRNAWALGLGPPPSIAFQPQPASQITTFPAQHGVLPKTPESSIYSGRQYSATPSSAFQRRALVTDKSEPKSGAKKRVLTENEPDGNKKGVESFGSNLARDRRSLTLKPAMSGTQAICPASIMETAAPSNVNIRLLSNLEITAEEYLTFFPLHTQWNEGINRLVQNGWNFESVARFINWARNLQPAIGRGRLPTTIETQIVRSDERIYSKRYGRWAPRPEGRVDDLTTMSWAMSGRLKLRDWRLSDVIKGVVHFPTGEGRRELTMAMEYARDHPNELSATELGEYLMVSDIPMLIQKHGFSSQVTPIRLGPEPDDHPDFRALSHHRERINLHDWTAKQQRSPARPPPKKKARRTPHQRDMQDN